MGDFMLHRRPMRAFIAIVFGTASFAIVGITAAAPAGATPGSVTLDSGISGQANDVELYGASAAGILYSVTDVTGNVESSFMQPTGGSSTPLPAGIVPTGRSSAIVGSMVGGFDGVSTFTYTTVTGSTSGTATVPAGGVFQATSVDGYLYSAVPNGSTATHIYDVNVSTHVTTDMATVPGSPSWFYVYASTSGVLIETYETEAIPPASLYYVAYTAPTQLIQLASSAPISSLPVLGGNSAAWIENPTIGEDDSSFMPADSTVVRIGLDGTNEVRTTLPYAAGIAVTATLTGVTIQNPDFSEHFETMPAAGGALTSYPTSASEIAMAAGNSFIVNLNGTPTTAGLYTTSSAAGPAIQIVTAGAQTLRATAIALSPGRAAWVDNGVGAGTWSRPLSTTGLTITPSSPTVVSSISDPSDSTPLSSSGARTAYMVNSPTAEALWVSGPAGTQQIANPVGTDGVTISGTRLLQNHQDGSATLYNLVSGTSTDLAAPVGPFASAFISQQPYQLSGNKLAWLASDGSVWVKNLDTAVSTQLSSALTGAGQTVFGSVAVAGDTVAWNVSLCSPDGGGSTECFGQLLSYRNIATMGPVQTIPSAGPLQIALSPEYLAYNTYNPATTKWDLYVNPLYTSTVTDIAQLTVAFDRQFSISGSTIGWLGTDDLAHVQALTHVAERPRYLGNGITPSALVDDGTNTWNADFVASTNLTTCTVTIKSGSTTVRTLACDSSQTPFGEGVVSWDGKNSGGTLVAAGSYAWTLTGANADGAMLDADGGSTAISGTIAVTAAATGGGTGGSSGGGGSAGGSGGSSGGGGSAGGGGGGDTSTTDVDRLSGADRFSTAVAASQAEFPSGGATAVVLARADDYADALVGGPLAAEKNAPLLLTTGAGLPAATQAELTRVLGSGGQVYLLGGTSAIPSSVESQLKAMGYQTTRLAGSNRYATAVDVADAMGDPATVLLATGTNYPDALAAGPAAAHVGGAVLLTGGSVMPSETAAYLAAHAKTTYAIGGPAAAAAPTAHAIVGADRYATAVTVATTFFVAPTTVGVATGTNFPDALAAGAMLAHVGAPLVLTGAALPGVTLQYLMSIASSATSAHVFGGTSAVSETVRTAISNALQH
jgi:putative cell wall-binding protein